jgi:phage baseplate assembly protein W
MPADTSYLGTDLSLGFIADEQGRTAAGPFSQADLQAEWRAGVSPRALDLILQTGIENLVQSLVLRLMTERGELTALGHPNYGSRHHQLIGEPNTEANRNLLKLYMIECLKQEPRLDSIQQITVRQGAGLINRDKVDVQIAARMKGSPDPLILVIPFSFAGPLP